jgi:hypothetical protein
MKSLFFLALAFSLSACAAPDAQEHAQQPPAAQPSDTAAPDSAEPAPNEPAPDSTAPRITGPTLKPVDEGSTDPSLAAYRAGLLEAVRQRDAAKLIAALDPNIRTSFGGDGKIEGFRKQWSPEKKDSPVWAELETILTNGGTFLKDSSKSAFWAPYVYSAWPDGFDAFEHGAVMGENIPLRDSASDTAKTIGLLSHNIVKLSREETSGFTRVETLDGQSGWVRSNQVRSPIGYRAGFNKQPSGWKMTGLVAGD